MTALKGHGASILVAALGSAFGVALLQITGALTAVIEQDDVTGSSTTVALMLRVLAFVFIVISVYVAAVVTANTFSTIVAGRVRSIALLRLLGSSARRERGRISWEGLVVGILGSFVGGLVGTGVAVATERIAVAADAIPDAGYTFTDPVILIPVVGVVLTTWAASWVGSRRVTTVTPLEALGRSEELSREETLNRSGRNRTALVLVIVGFALLGLGVVAGLVNPAAILIGLVGGILSFTGIVLGADVVMPPVLRLAGRLSGRSAPARLAAENAVRHPQRSSRATIGLVIGVTLVTMFAVAMAGFETSIRVAQSQNPDVYQGVDPVLTATTAVFSVLVGFSGLIAAVGLVNNLSLSVLQRRRELGLLRALGFTVAQVRRMVLAESAQLTFSAVVLGLLLGAFYGWAGAQSLLGTATEGIVIPGMPWVAIGAVVLAGAAITAIASWAPARSAVRVSPVEALAVD
ncbi:ABC transporter permease [Pseudolysinimonas sp.]|jgi:putative ABC transport system permease protein|uniref:ABC transporter permease n=1 Tax=Pseudolysinimonas sp. TaxID=2680009 RepID=UPI003784FA07